MRIVHVASSADGSSLGRERTLVNLAIAQKARGSEVAIMIDRMGVFTEACHNYGIPVTVTTSLSQDDRVGLMPPGNVVQDFINSLKKFDVDLIHCHSSRAASLGVVAGNRINIPCFVMGDRALPMAGEIGRSFRFVTISLSEAGYRELKNQSPWLDAYYVKNGTRGLPLTRAQEMEMGSPRSVNLMYTGSLIQQKGIDIAILAMVELRRRRGQDCPTLNIYGDGDQRERLTEMTAVLELNDIVQFHGFKRDVMGLCPSTDIFVLPSRWEVAPLVVLEAMSRGMPIVATDVGEVATMLPDRRYGRLVPPDSIIALADAIDSLLTDVADGRFSPDLLIERHRSHYTDEKMAERIEAVYNQVLLNWSGAPDKPR